MISLGKETGPIYLQQMLIHVVAEVLEQRHFLGEILWKDVKTVKMFRSVSFDVLHVTDITTQRRRLEAQLI